MKSRAKRVDPPSSPTSPSMQPFRFFPGHSEVFSYTPHSMHSSSISEQTIIERSRSSSNHRFQFLLRRSWRIFSPLRWFPNGCPCPVVLPHEPQEPQVERPHQRVRLLVPALIEGRGQIKKKTTPTWNRVALKAIVLWERSLSRNSQSRIQLEAAAAPATNLSS